MEIVFEIFSFNHSHFALKKSPKINSWCSKPCIWQKKRLPSIYEGWDGSFLFAILKCIEALKTTKSIQHGSPAHRAIDGNEKADELARKRSTTY